MTQQTASGRTADSVEKVVDFEGRSGSVKRMWMAFYAGIGISFAILRRFWAVAAMWNSSLAPFGPLRRNRSNFMIRLRWANSISTFFR